MVPFTKDDGEEMKHSLKQVGKKYVFTIKKLGSEDAGLYSVDVEGVNIFSTDFKGTSPMKRSRILVLEWIWLLRERFLLPEVFGQ